jgi:hypothetical protein
MKVEQVIYTSCRRGITRETSGFQVFSYSEGIIQWESRNNIGALFLYEPPHSGLPNLPTEQEARTLFPKKYVYRVIAGEDNLCGISLSTYIGRDYPDGSQRPGNFLSHALIFKKSECATHPALFLSSQSLKSWIDPVQFRSEEKPALLPTIQIDTSVSDTVSAISRFLLSGKNSAIYRQMLACLLHSKDDRHGRKKRIFIHDTAENKKHWIVALMMAFPTDMALDIEYSTYEMRPVECAAHIVGVEDHTYYSPGDSVHGMDYYFDIPRGIIDSSSFPDIQVYCQFVCDAMTHCFDSLKKFHDFMPLCSMKSFSDISYDNVTRLRDTYSLYTIVHGKKDVVSETTTAISFTDFYPGQIKELLTFAESFAKPEIHTTLQKNALAYFHRDDIDDDIFATLLDYLKIQYQGACAGTHDIPTVLTQIVVTQFCDSSISSESFIKSFQRFEKAIDSQFRVLFYSRIDRLDREKWLANTWRSIFLLRIIVADKSKVALFADKSSLPSYALENFTTLTMSKSQDEQSKAISAMIEKYARQGIDSINMLYMALRESSKVLTSPHLLAFTQNEYSKAILSFPLQSIIQTMSVLAQKSHQSDVTRLLDMMATDKNVDFFDVASQLYTNIPELFKEKKDTLVKICLSRAATLSENYKVFRFIIDTKAFSLEEIKNTLMYISQKLPIYNLQIDDMKYIRDFATFCSKNSLLIPQRIALAKVNLSLADLCRHTTKARVTDKAITHDILLFLKDNKVSISGIDSTEQDSYLSDIGSSFAILINISGDYSLPDNLFEMEKDILTRLKDMIFCQFCQLAKKTNHYEKLIYMIIQNAFHRPYLSSEVMIKSINKAQIHPDALDKVIKKRENDFKGFYERKEPLLKESFTAFINRFVSALDIPKSESFKDKVKDKVLSFFSTSGKKDAD